MNTTAQKHGSVYATILISSWIRIRIRKDPILLAGSIINVWIRIQFRDSSFKKKELSHQFETG
jgi:hypothetical protein